MMPTLIASKSVPDVLQMYAQYIQEYVDNGILEDLSDVDPARRTSKRRILWVRRWSMLRSLMHCRSMEPQQVIRSCLDLFVNETMSFMYGQ
jgi:glutamine synthetase adenylyltransferase